MPEYTARHICALPHEEEFPKLPKDADCCQKLKVSIIIVFLISHRNPRCHQQFRSKESIVAERKRHMKRKTYVFNHPYSVCTMHWDIFMMVMFAVGLTFLPFEVAFFFHEDVPFYSVRSYLLFFLDIIYIVDIILRLNTGFIRNKQVVLSCKDVFCHYVFGPYFIFDVISSVPMEIVGFDIKNKYVEQLQTASLVKVYKFVPLVRCMVRTCEYFQLSTKTFYLLFYYSMTVLIIHWFACLHYMLPQFRVFYLDRKWDEGSWVVQSSLEVRPVQTQYFDCVYRAAVLLLFVGHGYYTFHTTEDAILATVSYITGFITYSFYFVSMIQILAASRASRLKYQVIINQVHEYMRHKKLPLSIQKRLITYYDYKYKRRYFREAGMKASISERLRKEMVLWSCKKLVDSVSLFADLPEAIIGDIISLLKPEFFLANDIIVKAGTTGDCIYFLSSGTVTVLTPTGKEICHLMDGAYFGEIGLIMKNQKRVATVVAIEICETYKLDRKNFLLCFSHDSSTYKKVEAVAKERFMKAAAIEELHKQYLLERTKPESELLG